MKTAIAVVLMLLFLTPLASANDGVITVTRSGKTATYSTDEYVVVKRRKGPRPVVKQPVAPAPQKCPEVVAAAPVEQKSERKNTLTLYGGAGPGSHETSIKSSYLHIEDGYGFVMGLDYGRKLTDRWSIHGMGMTNGSLLLGGGYSF